MFIFFVDILSEEKNIILNPEAIQIHILIPSEFAFLLSGSRTNLPFSLKLRSPLSLNFHHHLYPKLWI
jgi:hypothetical protein